MTLAVKLRNVTISYARHPAIHHISGTFEAGTLTAITGPNGAGKSTLLKAIAGMIKVDEGSIEIAKNTAGRIAYLPQAAELQRDFPLSVLHLVTTGSWHDTGSFAAITPELKTRARDALATVGLAGFERRNLTSLSMGQFQRALFARLLMQDASLILLDEPFTAIDATTATHLLEIIKQWHKEGRTIICVLHDFEQIRAHFSHCLLLARECVAWDAPAEALSTDRLMQAHFFREPWSASAEICEQPVKQAL